MVNYNRDARVRRWTICRGGRATLSNVLTEGVEKGVDAGEIDCAFGFGHMVDQLHLDV